MTTDKRNLMTEQLYRLAVIALAGTCGFIINSIWDHESRLVRIESNRFTASDGEALVSKLEMRLGVLELQMARAETKLDELREHIQRLLEKVEK